MKEDSLKGVLVDRNAYFRLEVSSSTGTLRFDELEDKSECLGWTLEHEFRVGKKF
jgi:hypothetical protein